MLRQPDALGGMLQGLGERLVFAQDAGGRRRNQRAGGQGGGDGFGVREVFERAAQNPGNSERCGDQHQPQQKGGSGCEDGRWRGASRLRWTQPVGAIGPIGRAQSRAPG